VDIQLPALGLQFVEDQHYQRVLLLVAGWESELAGRNGCSQAKCCGGGVAGRVIDAVSARDLGSLGVSRV
jgi:hypothetical protein